MALVRECVPPLSKGANVFFFVALADLLLDW